MSLWRNARAELAGAWRSLRYDLRRRGEADADATEFAEAASTGLNTFGGQPLGRLHTGDDEFDRPPRRLMAVSAFGVLALIGAAGSYFAVVNGLGALLVEEPGGAGAVPLAAEARPPSVSTERQTPTSRLGYGTTIEPIPAPQSQPRRTKATDAPSAPASPTAPTAPTQPTQPRAVPPVPPSCRCTPPVPTPTFPDHGSSGYPSPSASTSASPSPNASADGDGGSDDGSDDGDDAGGDDGDDAAGDGDRHDRPRDHTGY